MPDSSPDDKPSVEALDLEADYLDLARKIAVNNLPLVDFYDPTSPIQKQKKQL